MAKRTTSTSRSGSTRSGRPVGKTATQAQSKAAGTKAKTRRKAEKTQRQSTTTDVTHEQIAARAYEIWQDKGQPQHMEQEFWFQAERELLDTGHKDALQGKATISVS